MSRNQIKETIAMIEDYYCVINYGLSENLSIKKVQLLTSIKNHLCMASALTNGDPKDLLKMTLVVEWNIII